MTPPLSPLAKPARFPPISVTFCDIVVAWVPCQVHKKKPCLVEASDRVSPVRLVVSDLARQPVSFDDAAVALAIAKQGLEEFLGVSGVVAEQEVDAAVWEGEQRGHDVLSTEPTGFIFGNFANTSCPTML